MRHKEALIHEINLVLTDPDTNLSHGARRALDYVIGQLEALAQPERHELQADGKHPAPCARFCEANAFQIEIRRLKAQLAQPEQEPVAWRWLSSKTWKQWSLSDDKKLVAEAVEWLGEEKVQPLYTTPPQRTWVGLTDEDVVGLCREFMGQFDKTEFIKATESKLKEKNT